MKMKSAPALSLQINPSSSFYSVGTDLTPAIKASQPQCLPITSSTNALECDAAVELILSIASQILCSAVGAPIVRSVMLISLSIDPTRPTIRRWPCFLTCSSVILPSACSVLMWEGHSERNTSAPVSEPSPPQMTSASMPSLMRLYAAARRPSGVRNVLERAVPMSVPPYYIR